MRKNKLSRRDFLKLGGVASAGLALSACGVDATALPLPTATTTSTITPLPTLTNTATPTPTPRPPTIADLARNIGMDVGIEAGYLGLFSPNKTPIKFSDAPEGYIEAISNFSILTDGYSGDPAWTDYKPEIAFQYWHDISLFCQEHDIRLALDHIFYGAGHFDEGSPVQYLVKAPKEEIETWMQKRVKKFFEIPYFSQLNFVNEVLWGNDETGKFGWVTDLNPFYRIWGKDYVRQAYLTVFNEAIASGKKVGEDLRIIYNATPIEYDSPKSRYEYEFLSKLKEQLQEETGLDRPFDIGMQFHTRTVPLKDVVCWGPAAQHLEKASLTEHLRKFGEIGDIHISEFSIATPDKDQEINILHTVVESAIESGVCNSLIMWSPFITLDAPWADCDMQHLFDVKGDFDNPDFSDPQPSYMFDELYKILRAYAN